MILYTLWIPSFLLVFHTPAWCGHNKAVGYRCSAPSGCVAAPWNAGGSYPDVVTGNKGREDVRSGSKLLVLGNSDYRDYTTRGDSVRRKDSSLVSGWNCTAGLYWTALVLLVLVELLYTPEVCRRRGAGSREEARPSGAILCSVYAAAVVVRDDQVLHVRPV